MTGTERTLPADEHAYTFRWRHGPAPGLEFYSGLQIAYASDIETAQQRAKRDICRRGCFSPGCISLQLVEDAR